MCLDKLRRFKVRQRTGWKVFLTNNQGRLFGECISLDRQRPVGRWLNEKNFRENVVCADNPIDELSIVGSIKKYPKGWHVYLNEPLPGHDSYLIRKVKFRNVVARGYQDKRRIVVVKEIYILPRKE